MAALAYNLGKREINHYFSVRSAKVLALVAVLLLALCHLASRRYRGNDSCEYLLSSGRFLGEKVWQPHSCMMQTLLFNFQIATRKACGLALAKLGHANDRVVVLDGDSKNSTFSEIFKKEHPERFVECCIAEQNMVCMLGTSILSLLIDKQWPTRHRRAALCYSFSFHL
ncbi:hypothetical protein J1605_015799 [Eschrichtius robustus]|uniref:Transketolase-like pyrimidine-binding domain-containing protein n=1 Tax=Eschrichtius robustus TaxID=9764 RepID=A0AB34GAB4_ESCRO|nr:hypothetical protein J1605_015799 [Eschrichtius robustus]